MFPSQFFSLEGSTSTASRPTRCFTCSSDGVPHKTPRNLVVCIDGTANKFGRNNTNVVKIFGAVDGNTTDPLPNQYTYYSSGIGTRPRVFNVLKRMQRAISDKLDMAIAWNVEEIVKDAYTWLAGKYQEGDQIYLFGFSRGAYQVRILAWMIYEVGLIKNPTEKQIGSAYDHFESIMSHQPNAHDMAREFKVTFSWEDVKVHFIGVWDTVSAVGFGRGDVCPSGSSAAAHACHIRHALALDERRVKFIPEYFLEMNSPDLRGSAEVDRLESSPLETRNGSEFRRDGSEILAESPQGLASDGSTLDSSISGEKAKSAAVDANSYAQSTSNRGKDRNISDVKEVWFAGTHSDVGGTHRPGKSVHAGNISLMWMRHEASASGLVLKPADILWTDEDLDFGTIDSMTYFWRLIEFLPVLHQVSYSGFGENATRLHLFESRRIIPGQKIHASVQFANTYIPEATFGNGFGNPLETAGPMPSKENDIWEKEAFDHATYVTLFNYLTGRQADTPFYLHKLLFMLRFTEGQWFTAEVADQRKTLADLIIKQSGLVRLVAIAAYFETLSFSRIEESFPDEVFVEARHSLRDFMKPDQPDWPRAVALLRPLAKHEKLRESILIDGVVDGFMRLLDHTICFPGEHFAHVMDALCSLIELHPDPIVNKLVESHDRASRGDRLSLMLDTDGPSHLTAVLRVIISLAQQAPFLCLKLKPRLHELAKRGQGPISLWAVQALVEVSRAEVIQEPVKPGYNRLTGLNSISSTQLEYLHASSANVSPARNWMRIGDSLLYRIFSAGPLGNTRRKFIESLLNVADGRDIRARTAATFTLIKLRQVSDNLSTYLQDQGLQDVFVRQLQFKDSALLAAYALTRCLTHEEFGKLLNYRPQIIGYIVNMIRLDYFDEAIGITEGFTIFEDLMRCGELKHKLLGYDITTLLERKLGAGTPRGTRTGLIYLNIFRTHGEYSLIRNLVERGMSGLRTHKWRTQKAGTAILCSLAKTWFGAEALKPILPEVVDMLLPTHDPDTQRAGGLPASRRYKPPSSLLGPAFVMHVFAENETLREDIRQTVQYRKLKHLYLFGDLLGAQETPIWQVRTPTRDDVLDVISQMIKSVDSVQGSTNAGFILPRIQHWHRIARVFRDGVVEVIMLPAAFAGIAALTIVGAIVLAPVYLSRRIGRLIQRPWRLSQQDAIIRSLKLPDSESPVTIPSASPRVNLHVTDNHV